MEAVIYECGCDAATVGQHFKDGVLVCPIHEQSTAPYTHPEAFTGTVQIMLTVRAQNREQVQRWTDELVETLLREDIVTGLETYAG